MIGRRRTVQLLDFEAEADEGFAAWLDRTNQSVVISHSNKLIACGLDAIGRLTTDPVTFERVTGVCRRDDGALVVAADHELWLMTDAVSDGERSPRGADRWLMCRTARFVGGLLPADPAATRDECWFVSVALSAICSLHDVYSAEVRWTPPFITAVRPDLRCRLTGLGIRDGRPAVVTSASQSDVAGGWSEHRVDGGVVIDVPSGEVIAAGLSMPHSPRWHAGAWWLVQAGTGELGYLDGDRFVAVGAIDGFARGLAISEGVAIVGGSGSRWDELVDGLPVGERVRANGGRPESGAFMFDLGTGGPVGSLRLDGTAREVADIVVLPATRRVELSSPRGSVAQESTTFPVDHALAGGASAGG